jgi:hypothetical protein
MTLTNPSCGGSLSQMRNKGLKWFACCRFDDLVRRFERPDGRNRWDSQLFEINPSIEEIHEGSQAIVKAVAFLSGDRTLMGLRNSQVLQPTIATQNVRTSETNSLYELDKATQVTILFSLFHMLHKTGPTLALLECCQCDHSAPFFQTHPRHLHLAFAAWMHQQPEFSCST